MIKNRYNKILHPAQNIKWESKTNDNNGIKYIAHARGQERHLNSVETLFHLNKCNQTLPYILAQELWKSKQTRVSARRGENAPGHLHLIMYINSLTIKI